MWGPLDPGTHGGPGDPGTQGPPGPPGPGTQGHNNSCDPGPGDGALTAVERWLGSVAHNNSKNEKNQKYGKIKKNKNNQKYEKYILLLCFLYFYENGSNLCLKCFGRCF